ncbi:uncharacterized protein LOC112690323 [Sipha flava]|uniref:Uncharacterized protein LOC112690323 n=1 Tax=Sipha flava TaxID=143950 RepID=A0A2S2R1R6_9HEMI|nr:uncharacterized protein LOC112690323 [Sipha flava]
MVKEREVLVSRDRSTGAAGGKPRRRRRSDECVLVHGLCSTAIALTVLRAISATVAAAVRTCLHSLYGAFPVAKLTTTLTKTAGGLLPLLSGWTSSAALYAATQFGRSKATGQGHRPGADRSNAEEQRAYGRSSSDDMAVGADQRARDRTRSDRRKDRSPAWTDRVAVTADGDAWMPLLQVAGRGLQSFLRSGRGHATRSSRSQLRY